MPGIVLRALDTQGEKRYENRRKFLKRIKERIKK